MGRIIISESEKKRILTLYGVRLNEQTQGQQTQGQQPQGQKPTTVADLGTTVKSWNSNVTFDAGYYNKSYVERSEIPNQIKEVIAFLNQPITDPTYRSFVVSVEISSGESKIPNTDKEAGLPPPKNRVDIGFLAQQRSNTIVEYVTSLLKDTKVGVKPIINTPKIGETEWVGQKFCPSNKLPSSDTQGYACLEKTFNPGNGILNWQSGKESEYKSIAEKFRTEQFVSVSIKVNELRKPPQPSLPKIDPPCLTNLEINVDYPKKAGHECNYSLYQVYFKGDKDTSPHGILLKRDDGKDYASLNNNAKGAKERYDKDLYKQIIAYDNNPDDQAGPRFNKFIITSEIVEELKKQGSTTFDIILKCHNPLNLKNSNGYGKKPIRPKIVNGVEVNDPEPVGGVGFGCHTDVGDIRIVNGKGQQIIHKGTTATTPNEKNEYKNFVTIDSCGNVVRKRIA